MYRWDNQEEQIGYITKRLGRHISARTLQRTLKVIKSGEVTREFFNHYAKERFRFDHMQLLQTAYMLRQSCLKIILHEENKTDESLKDKELIMKASAELRAVSQMINDVKQSAPIMAEMAAVMDKYEAQIKEQAETIRRLEVGDVIRQITK